MPPRGFSTKGAPGAGRVPKGDLTTAQNNLVEQVAATMNNTSYDEALSICKSKGFDVGLVNDHVATETSQSVEEFLQTELVNSLFSFRG